MKKKIIFLMILYMMLFNTVAYASETSEKPLVNVYVHDNADLLTPQQESLLFNYLEDAEDLQWNVLFLTYDNAAGKSTMVYSDDYMDTLFPDYENNIAFIIDMDNREYYVNTMGDAIECINNSEIEKILDAGEAIYDGKYYKCLSGMADKAFEYARANANLPVKKTFWEFISNGLVAGLVATAIGAAILVANHFSGNKKQSAEAYMPAFNYKVLRNDKRLIRTYQTVERNYYQPKSSSSSSSSRSGGSSHRSSSGRSHGGGGRRF